MRMNKRSSDSKIYRFMGTRLTLSLLLLVMAWLIATSGGAESVIAQDTQPDVTVEPTQPPPQITVTRSEPAQIYSGQSAQLTVFGGNFTSSSIVWLENVGILQTTFVNGGVLTAVLPATLTTRDYEVKVIDPGSCVDPVPPTCKSPNKLRVVSPPAPTNTPLPPATIAPPPTDVPGAPSLLIRSFNANPSTIAPGGTVTFSFEVVNQGSRTAQGISVSVDPGGKFIPTNGQASVILPDLGVGASAASALTVIAARDVPGGPQTVSITMTFRDFTGTGYSSKGSLSVNVQDVPQSSQITLARYLVDPNPVKPGKPVKVTILLTNSGNETASQVLVRVASDSGLLLAGPQGDSFPAGSLKPGASTSVDMPLIVSTAAKAGPQAQAVTITYLQKGESKSINGSMTLDVAKVVAPAPLLLLQSYSTGKDILKPGEQFTLTMEVKNVGDDDASSMLVTFGTVDTTNSSDATPGTTSTTPSTTFAPLGSGGTIFAGTVKAEGGILKLKQDFIVNGTVDSGIYNLPITLRYQKSDGSGGQDSLRASLVVVMPPQLQINAQNPIPAAANVGETVSLALRISNKGKKPVNFTKVTVSGENINVFDGKEALLSPVQPNDDASVNGSFSPAAVGPAKLTVTLYYMDDLNKEQTIIKTYELQANAPPPPIEVTPPPNITPTPVDQPVSQRDMLGKLLLGLLGLGS